MTIKKRKQEAEKIYTWSIPTSQWFTEKSKIISYNKNIIQPSFISFDSEKEEWFIGYFLEKSELVEFWYKNWTSSEQFFAVPYIDKYWEKQSFYPDFIVYLKSWIIWLFDLKSWFTLKDWTLKAKWLEEYIKNNTKKWKKIIGWLIEVNKVPNTETITMLINNTWNYSLENRKNFSVFNNNYIENYNFEEIAWISENYKKDIQNEIDKLFHELNNKKSSYVFFIDEQKDSWDFDFEKASELNREISEIENKIKEKEKVLSELV